MKIILAVVVGCLVSHTVLAAQSSSEKPSYLCQADVSTGVAYRDGAWRQTNFDVKPIQYIISYNKEQQSYVSTLKGQQEYRANCTLQDKASALILDCNSSETAGMAINLDNLQFSEFSSDEFLMNPSYQDDAQLDDMPPPASFITVGRCEILKDK